MEKRTILLKYKLIAFLVVLGVANIRVSFAALDLRHLEETGGQQMPPNGRGPYRNNDNDVRLYVDNNGPKKPHQKQNDHQPNGYLNMHGAQYIQIDGLSDDGSDSESSDSYDAIEHFKNLTKEHKMPSDLHLAKDDNYEAIVTIGHKNMGKTTLSLGITGDHLREQRPGLFAIEENEEEHKYAGEELVYDANDKHKLIGHGPGRKSFTIMPNILRLQNEKWVDRNWINKNWFFVDCPGFDDNTEGQAVFIRASIQIVLRQIKKLRAVLCVVDKDALHEEITPKNIEQHKLGELVRYLHKLLKEPLVFCRSNLVLVVNKTGGEYRLNHAKAIFRRHLKSLEKIKASYKKKHEEKDWNQYGEPMVKLLQILLLNDNQIICMPNLTERNNFKVALRKIEKIETLLNSEDITIALDTASLQKLLKLIIGSHPRIAAINATYEACKRELQNAYNSKQQKYTGYKNRHQKAYNKGFWCTVGCGVVMLGILVIIVNCKVSKDDRSFLVTCLVVLVGVCICLLSGLHLPRPPAGILGPPTAPSPAEIKNYTLSTLAKNKQKLVGKKRKKEAFYYELTGLGDILLKHPVLQIYREAYAQKYRQPRRR